jgi:hypothetical protein
MDVAQWGALNFAVPGDYSFGGTVFVTNATANANSASVYFGDDDANNDEMTVNVSGGATIFANTIRTVVRESKCTFAQVNAPVFQCEGVVGLLVA